MQPSVTASVLTLLLYFLAVGNSGGNPGTVPSTVDKPGNSPAQVVETGHPQDLSQPNSNTDAVTGFVKVIGQKANIRKGPGTNYPVVTSVSRGTRLEVITVYQSWYQVRLSTGTVGWVVSSLVDRGLPSEPSYSGTASSGTGLAKEVIGYYAEYYEGDLISYNSFKAYRNTITGIATFSFYIDAQGEIKGTHSRQAINLARMSGVKVLALIHNSGNGGFNRWSVSSLLSSGPARRNAVENIARLMDVYGYDGVNVDLENVDPRDRPYLTAFMQEIASKLRAKGRLVTISVPAKYWDDPNNQWSGAFDYYELGRIVDRIMIMTYDEHELGSGPGPVASIGWVEKVIRYAATQIPRRKILMGIPTYGYEWNVFPARGIRALTYYEAISLATRYGITPSWDSTAMVPYFRYKYQGATREVWFESSYSLGPKIDLVNKYNLAGIAIWRLGYEDQGNWEVIRRKLIAN